MNSTPISPRTSADFRAGEGVVSSQPSANNMLVQMPDDPTFYAVTPSSFDIRESLRRVVFLNFLSPLGLNFLTWRTCMAVLVGSYALPCVIRLRYPRFMDVNIVDNFRIYAGGSMACIAYVTALQLQLHNTTVKFHPKFYKQPLNHWITRYLFLEMALNGSAEEKGKTASWLRWIHPHVDRSIADEKHGEFRTPDNVEMYEYTNEVKAYMIYTLTWAAIAFQTRFGGSLSERAKDAIVLEYTCLGLRIGVPMESLSKNYESFLVSFDRQLDILDGSCPVTPSAVENAETSLLAVEKHCITRILVRVALMIGFDLLPQRVRKKYRLTVLNTSWKRAIQKVLISVVWFIYPMLMRLPLRGAISLFLVLEPQLRPVFVSSLEAIRSMDILSDEPVYSKANPPNQKPNEDVAHELPSYLLWLESGKDGRPLLQGVLVRILEAQLKSAQAASLSSLSLGRITPWMRVPTQLAVLTLDTIRRSVLDALSRWATQIKESLIFQRGESKMPRHIGIILDGNRRFARRLGQPVIFGHQCGTETTRKLFEWWLRFIPNTVTFAHTCPGPQYLTLWTFSIGNLKRPQEELDGLFRLMTAEFKSLAFTSIVHLFQMRIRVIGSREGLPQELIDSIELLEEMTRTYSRLFIQFAVGYGGRDEIVRSVKQVLATGGEITEDAISEGTFCAQASIPPVELIVRTSEFRTSGFFLWDTQTAELHFINKLWPEFDENDWLDTLSSFARREIRGGK